MFGQVGNFVFIEFLFRRRLEEEVEVVRSRMDAGQARMKEESIYEKFRIFCVKVNKVSTNEYLNT